MRSGLRIVVLAALLTGAFAIPAAQAETDAAALQRLEAAWNEAHLGAKPASLATLWSEDLTLLVPKMDPMSKQEALAFWSRVPIHFSRYESRILSTRILGTTAITTGMLWRTRDFGGKVMADRWLFTKVYALQGKDWKVVAYHACDAPDAANAE